MTLDEFETCVADAVRGIPAPIRRRLDNLEIVVEEEARPAVPPLHDIRVRGVLLGLYQGVPLSRRTTQYGGALPDKITLFKSVIEQLAGFDEPHIRELVSEVVRHEIAHHLGFDEAAVRRMEHGGS